MLVAQTKPDGHEKPGAGPQGFTDAHDVLPGTQKPAPVEVVKQKQSGLLVLQVLRLPQVVPMHSGCGEGWQVQVLGLKTWPVGQVVETQVPLHSVVPVGQAQVQVAGLRTSPSGQVGTHWPWHSTKPALQTKAHVPVAQFAVALAGAVQTTPHVPQFWTVLRGVQAPLQQPCPVAQAFPHAPQLATSVWRLVQVVLPQQVGAVDGQQTAALVPTPHTFGWPVGAAGPQV